MVTPFSFDGTVYVADANPVSDPIPWIDLCEYEHLGGTALASGNEPCATYLPCDAGPGD
jgi:hypothetical protein